MNQIRNDEILILGRRHVILLLLAFGINKDKLLAPVVSIFVAGNGVHKKR